MWRDWRKPRAEPEVETDNEEHVTPEREIFPESVSPRQNGVTAQELPEIIKAALAPLEGRLSNLEGKAPAPPAVDFDSPASKEILKGGEDGD